MLRGGLSIYRLLHLRTVSVMLLTKGHTESACDRAFNLMNQCYCKCWRTSKLEIYSILMMRSRLGPHLTLLPGNGLPLKTSTSENSYLASFLQTTSLATQCHLLGTPPLNGALEVKSLITQIFIQNINLLLESLPFKEIPDLPLTTNHHAPSQK